MSEIFSYILVIVTILFIFFGPYFMSSIGVLNMSFKDTCVELYKQTKTTIWSIIVFIIFCSIIFGIFFFPILLIILVVTFPTIFVIIFIAMLINKHFSNQEKMIEVISEMRQHKE